MKKLLFCGDVHGKETQFRSLIHHLKEDEILIQVGDMGLGFEGLKNVAPFGDKVKFIRGNHDSPNHCRKHPNYLGDYGYNKELDLFFISGAYSIDKEWRIPDVSWWQEEELSYSEFQKCIQLYQEIKPKYVVSHDCPESIRNKILRYSHHDEQSITNQALENMWLYHQPEVWVFGHHHWTKRAQYLNTIFQCLNELEIKSLDAIKNDSDSEIPGSFEV